MPQNIGIMNIGSPLGKSVAYPDRYAPGCLFALPRSEAREKLGLGGEIPFAGVDIWNAWELTWLDAAGKPAVATAEIRIPADSPAMIESKSLKLYLHSFSMARFASASEVGATIARDLGACLGAAVDVELRAPLAGNRDSIARLPGICLDEIDVACDVFDVDPAQLEADERESTREELYSHLLRSLCPVTSQPDLGSVMIAYEGPRIDRAALLRYIVSYREHAAFHEACIERMFLDISRYCRCEHLTVYARYQRRGGIDINPFRSNFQSDPPNARLWRQ